MASYLQRLDAVAFLEMLSGNSNLSAWLLKLYSQEVFDQLISATQANALSAKQRLEHLLAQFVEPRTDNVQITESRVSLPLSHHDLAGLVGVTPEHLSRLFTQLVNEGVIRRYKGWIIITDLRKLQPVSLSTSLVGLHA